MFHSIPHPGEFGYDTWPEGAYKKAGGVHNWSEFTVDEQHGIAFIPFGTARFDFYGGDRVGNNLFANSLVALDARTGKRLWHYQLVHHDLWDYDLPQAPKLLTLRQNGRNIDVVAQATKFGFIFVFERKTGKPVFPIEERPVPQSDVPGEVSSPTQPFPTKVPPFARQSFTEKDINPYLPEAEKERLRQLLRSVRNEGLFTPPSLEGSIQLPGHNGGANWGSTAVDPTKGELYVVAKNMPTLMRLVLSNEEPTAGGALGGGGQSPIMTAEQKAQVDGGGQSGRGERARALHVAVRLHAEPDQRHDRDRAAVVRDHGVRLEHRRDQMAHSRWRRDRACRGEHPAEHWRAHAARRTAGDGWRIALRGDRVGPHGARLRSRDSARWCGARICRPDRRACPRRYEVGGRQFIVLPGCRWRRTLPGSLRRPRTCARCRPGGCAAGGGPEAQAARGAGAGGGGGGRGRGGAPPAPGAYIAYALPRK